MSFYSKWRTMGAMALGASLLVSSGCAETALVGQLDDSELQDLQVLPLAALGISREVNDLIFANGDYYDYGGWQDDIVHAGTSTNERAGTIGDAERYFNNGPTNGTFAQVQEAIWAAYKVVDLAYVLFAVNGEGGGVASFNTSPIVARGFLVGGQMERYAADLFCESTYQYGPTGGFNIDNLGDWAEANGITPFSIEASNINSKAEMYERAAFAFEQAIEFSERAIAAGDTSGQGEDSGNDVGYNYFDPSIINTAAYGGLAQVRLDLASLGVDPAANMAAAVAAAANVPTDFVEYWNTDGINLRENQNQNLSWDNDDLTHWADTLIIAGQPQIWGSAFTHLVEAGDLRAARIEDGDGGINRCYELATKVGATLSDVMDLENDQDRSNLTFTHGTGNNDCSRSSDRFSFRSYMEIDAIPRVLLDNWSNEDRDVESIDGTDARLVEAEVALMNNDLPLFTQKINEVRAFWNASPIAQPATAGALEYPNALDDAWSLLDRELMLDNHGVIGRRLSQLHRWNHPFITDNHTTSPYAQQLLEDAGAGYQRASCLPIPSDECNLNQAITCPFGN